MSLRDTPEKRSAHAEYMRQWREKNPERWKAIAVPARNKWRANNHATDLECNRVHRYTVRREILDLLGGQKCVHCGYDQDWRALQIDHIHGGGKKDSRTAGGTTNLWAFRRWLQDNVEDAKHVYQVLCANCNWIKRFENGEQPRAGKVTRGGVIDYGK
jgi:hypothetical protein